MLHARSVAALLVALLLPVPTGAAEPVHGIAMHGAPKHPAGFQHFPYVNPAAPKGGRLVLGAQGTFDSLNPFIYKGVTPGNMREYVFESLMARSGDEPFTLYGLIAESVELPEDRSSVTFHLDPEARFSDGTPITPEDVLFSHALLKDKGWPYHRSHYAKVAKAEKIGERSVRFTFDAAGDREIPLILALLPILPRHKIDRRDLRAHDTGAPSRQRALHRRQGRCRTLRHLSAATPTGGRATCPSCAAASTSMRSASSISATPPPCSRPSRPARSTCAPRTIPAAGSRATISPPPRTGASSSASSRRGCPRACRRSSSTRAGRLFADPRVRRAFILLFDAEWINRSLFDSAYKRTQSFFERSDLSSHGRPADARERDAARFPSSADVKPEVLDGTCALPLTDGSGNDRANLRAALELLTEAGYKLEGGRLAQGRRAARHRVPGPDPPAGAGDAELRPHAGAAGHRPHASARSTRAQYWSRLKSFDFDMIQWTWSASLSPGNEQINRWSSRAADDRRLAQLSPAPRTPPPTP